MVSAANVLVTVNTDEARQVVKKMEDHYARAGQVQAEHAARMSKSQMLQNITATTIATPVKEVLEAAPKARVATVQTVRFRPQTKLNCGPSL